MSGSKTNFGTKQNTMNNVTAQINKLLKSQNTLERLEISSRIIDILESNQLDFGSTEKIIRSHFILQIKAYAVSQNRRQRALINRLVKFYDKNYNHSTIINNNAA